MKVKFISLLVILLFGSGFTLSISPPEIEIEESIIIKSNAQAVYEEIIHLNRLRRWYPYAKDCKEEGIKFQDGKLFWKAEKSYKNGHISLYKDSGSRFRKQIVFYTFLNQMHDPAVEEFNIEETFEGTILTWNFKFKYGKDLYHKYVGWLNNDKIQDEMLLSIQQLKQQVEARPKFNTYISAMRFDKLYFLSTTILTDEKVDSIQVKKEESLLKLYQFMEANGIDKSGNRIFFQEKLPQGMLKLTCGIGLREAISVSNNAIKLDSLPDGEAIVSEIDGSQTYLNPYYKDIENYRAYFSMQVSGSSWEEEAVTIPAPQSHAVRKYIIQPVVRHQP